MNIDSLFQDVKERLEEALRGSEVEIRQADETLVFWKDGERVGLEVPKGDVEAFFSYFDQNTLHEEKTVERVINKVKQDSFHYLVLKYL